MSELELLERLQTIKNKLDNNIELTDLEYKIFASMLYVAMIGIIQKSLDQVLKIIEGDKNE